MATSRPWRSKKGLVTELKSRQREFEDQVKAMVGEDEKEHTYPRRSAHWDYLSAQCARRSALQMENGKHVGVVVASGEILDGEQPPGTVGSDSLARLLRDALHDDSIKAVVLRIDSPGGSVYASRSDPPRDRAMRRRAADRRVDEQLAASGGYYIAMEADRC